MTATDDRVWSRPLVAAPTVLVVDDDDYVRTTIERMLTSLGAPAVHQASSAARALEMASYLAPEIDVVVTDLEMPGIDGMEFLRRLSEQWARASVLIISGKDEGILRSVELMAREYGLDVLGVLPKPATMGALREALSRHSRVLTSEAPAAAQASVTPHEIAGAIDRGEFVLFYQPKVQLATGQVSGAEGLVRWRHADRGLLLPGHFIGVAEQHGFSIG